MLLQSRPTAEAFAQLALAQRCMDFAVADAVNRLLDFAAAAFGQQVMLINADTGHQRPAAERAIRQIQRLDITQRLSTAQIAFGDHCLHDAGPLDVGAMGDCKTRPELKPTWNSSRTGITMSHALIHTVKFCNRQQKMLVQMKHHRHHNTVTHKVICLVILFRQLITIR